MPKSPRQETRQRLLDVATEIFARQGFRNARVRDICRRAKANVAAINYHFGGKKGLYNEVLQQSFFELAGSDPTDWGVDERASAEQRIHAFVKSLLTSLLSDGRGAFQAKLVAREMVDPTDALNRVIEKGIRPQIDVLLELIRDRLGAKADDQEVRRCASSIVGQCLFYYFGRPAIERIPLEKSLSARKVDAIADHITAFSMASLRSLARRSR